MRDHREQHDDTRPSSLLQAIQTQKEREQHNNMSVKVQKEERTSLERYAIAALVAVETGRPGMLSAQPKQQPQGQHSHHREHISKVWSSM